MMTNTGYATNHGHLLFCYTGRYRAFLHQAGCENMSHVLCTVFMLTFHTNSLTHTYDNLIHSFKHIYDNVIHAFNHIYENVMQAFNHMYENLMQAFNHMYEHVILAFSDM